MISKRREVMSRAQSCIDFRFGVDLVQQGAASNATQPTSGAPGHLPWAINRDVQVPDKPVTNRINPAMHRKLLAARPRVLDKHIRDNVPDLPDDVQLNQTVPAGALV